MAVVLEPTRYDDVRRALDPSIPLDGIPDEVIASKVYSGRAERYVDTNVPGAELKTGDELELVQMALVYKTAAFLSEALPTIKQTKLPDQEAIFDTYNRDQRTAKLNRMASEVIGLLNAASRRIEFPTLFTVAQGSYR